MSCSKHSTKSPPRKTHSRSSDPTRRAPRATSRQPALGRRDRIHDDRPEHAGERIKAATAQAATGRARHLRPLTWPRTNKAVDAAQANLTVAQQALLQATIVSPIDGTVVAVNMKVGDTVTAGSTTATIVIAGSGGYEAVTMIKVTDLPKLKVGQAASVQPDGSGATITGKITSIGLVSTSSTTGTTYPVTISLTGDTSQLHNGATATIAVTTATGDNGLAVPSSAVHNNNGTYTVTVLDGDTTKDVTVQVGAIGSEWTQIKTGLTAGQNVVLADLNQPLPNSATTASNGQPQNRFGRGGAAVVTRN